MSLPAFLPRLSEKLRTREGRELAALLVLAFIIVCGRIGNVSLYSIDGGVYALVAKELAAKPITEWSALTWNGSPFYENPHATPWLLALFMKIGGPSTLTATLPIALLSFATVALTYALGALLANHSAGLLAGTVLTLTPQFVKNGRNPMLEPALMFFIMLTIYAHLRWVRRAPADSRPANALRAGIPTGVFLAFAFLAKGPPAFLALAVILGFHAIAAFFPNVFARFRVPAGKFALHLLALLLTTVAVLFLVELWHRSVTGSWFLSGYYAGNLGYTVVEGRNAVANDLGYYFRMFFRYWPWWPMVLASGAILLVKRERSGVPLFTVGALSTLGTIAGFTLIKFKAPWYFEIIHVGAALLAGTALSSLLARKLETPLYLRSVCASIGLLLLVSTPFPSALSGRPRAFERFIERAKDELGNSLAGRPVSDCTLPHWRGRFLAAFYLGVEVVPCEGSGAPYAFIDTRTHPFREKERVLFSSHPFAIVERAANSR
jgi:4-amino-4-deoxy-L-arabinose transferase-like glycosyltransferase